MKEIMQTNRILLRRWQESDAEALFQCASDPEVGPRAGWTPHKSKEDSLNIIRTIFHNNTMWAIVLIETNQIVGCVGYLPKGCTNIPIDDNSGEVGYWIARPYWNKGICTEALLLLINYCFQEKGFSTLWGTHFIDNPASGKVMEKCGFQPTDEETTCSQLEVGADKTVRVMKLMAKTAK